jgi:chromosome segregation ATPase
MGNEKYVNYYIELMTNTMHDAVLRNISLQTNARISEEIINEQVEKIEHLEKLIVDLKETNSMSQSNANETTDRIVKEKDNLIDNLRTEIGQLINIRNDYENIKHQVNHVDTFRNELLKERNEHENTKKDYEYKISKLNEKIEYLQLTPAKRKKIEDEKNKLNQSLDVSSTTVDTAQEDGGTF